MGLGVAVKVEGGKIKDQEGLIKALDSYPYKDSYLKSHWDRYKAAVENQKRMKEVSRKYGEPEPCYSTFDTWIQAWDFVYNPESFWNENWFYTAQNRHEETEFFQIIAPYIEDCRIYSHAEDPDQSLYAEVVDGKFYWLEMKLVRKETP